MNAADFSQYRAHMSGLAEPVLRAAAQAEPAPGSVAWGVAPALLLLTDEAPLHARLGAGFRRLSLVGLAAASGQTPVRFTDDAGHHRDVYHPLVLHLHLAAFSLRYESLPADVWSACEDALPGAIAAARQVESVTDAAPEPAAVAVVLWHARCLLEQSLLTGRDVDAEVVDSVVHHVITQPGEAGSLHPRSADDSLDAWTFRELTGLHALANLALLRRNETWAKRVQEIASYHLEHTQPDFTTNQPWGVFGFLWPEPTRSFGEQQIHDCSTSAGSDSGGLGAVAAMLLADAAHALRAFEPAD